MLNKFNEKAQKIIALSESIAFDFGHNAVGSEHLLLAFLRIKDNKLKIALQGYNVSYENIKNDVLSLFEYKDNKPYYLEYTMLLKKIMDSAAYESKKLKEDKVSEDTLALSLLSYKESVAYELLKNYKVPIEKIIESLKKVNKSIKELDKIDDLVNLNLYVKMHPELYLKREREVEELIEALLRKKKPNALILGDAGVGKTSLVYHLASLINKGEVDHKLKNKTIYELDIAQVVSGSKYRGEFEEKLKKILTKVKNDNEAIIFIDEIHNICGAGGAEGAIDASNILKPYLSRGEIQLIGATSFEEYSLMIEKDKALERRFQVIKLREFSYLETYEILVKLKESYEAFHHLKIKDEYLKLICKELDLHITDRHFPDVAIDVLDNVLTHYKKLNKTNIDYQDVIEVLESNLKIKIRKSEDYQELYNLLTSNIFGQEEALLKLSKHIKCIEEGFYERKRPLGVFLLVGPSGVGKSESSKLLAKYYFKDERALIKIDMSLYSDLTSVYKLIGGNYYNGVYHESYLVESVRKSPHAVILLDEIEKADKEVLNVFLNIFDEGYLIDYNKRRVDFRNCIFVMTSNLGYSHGMYNEDNVGFIKNDYLKEKLNTALKKHFKVEFLNRIDEIIYFNPLTKSVMQLIAKEYLKSFPSELNLSYEISEELFNNEEVFKYGARGVKREVKKLMFNKLNEETIKNN